MLLQEPRFFSSRSWTSSPPPLPPLCTRVRLDGAFYNKEIIQTLAEEGLGYVVVAKMTRPLRKKMVAARYHEFGRGWEGAEFTYTPLRWVKEHRFVAVRRPKALEAQDIQQRLFTFKRYTYHRLLVTNLALTPEAVCRFYCDRAFQEQLLREFKDSYTMAKIPTRSFWANATYIEIVLWAYDLVLAFQFLYLPKEVQLEYLHLAPGTVVASRRMGQATEQQSALAPGQVSQPGIVRQDSSHCFQNQTHYLTTFAKLFSLRYAVNL